MLTHKGKHSTILAKKKKNSILHFLEGILYNKYILVRLLSKDAVKTWIYHYFLLKPHQIFVKYWKNGKEQNSVMTFKL